MPKDWILKLKDNEWPLTTIDRDRMIVRAIVIDDEDNFYFVRVNRDDMFGKATYHIWVALLIVVLYFINK